MNFRSCFHPLIWKPEAFSESADALSNPYCGFYHIVRYLITDAPPAEAEAEKPAIPAAHPSANAYSEMDAYPDALVLLEFNLKTFRKSEISENGIRMLNRILDAWSQCPRHPKLILRFLYDWDGVAAATEPDSLARILTHMEQISQPVNRHAGAVFLIQGTFTGNWGEMHHSRYSDDASVKTLIRKLHSVIHPSVFLSVRTPAQWRMILNAYDPSEVSRESKALAGRLGLFNDGMLGSDSDLGTYGDTKKRNAKTPSAAWTRAEELAFQNKLCQTVPNGGEVIYNRDFCALDFAAAAFRTMHVSYLNADYDSRVMEVWHNTTWNAADVFCNCDGYHYIQTHLGYRYVLQSARMKKTGWLHPAITLSITIRNIGFASAPKSFQTAVVQKHLQNDTCSVYPIRMELETIQSGQTQTISTKLPMDISKRGSSLIYLSVKDEATGKQILFGNQNTPSEHGYLLGQLET